MKKLTILVFLAVMSSTAMAFACVTDKYGTTICW